jgi:hypothetical protein
MGRQPSTHSIRDGPPQCGTADRATGRGRTGQHLLQDEKGLLVRREHIVFLQCSGEGGKHLRLNSRAGERDVGMVAQLRLRTGPWHCDGESGKAL